MHAIQACNPITDKDLVPNLLLPLVETHGLDKEMAELEAKLAKRTLEKKDIKICMKYIQTFFLYVMPFQSYSSY